MLLSVVGAMDHSITCVYAYFMYTEESGIKLLYWIVLPFPFVAQFIRLPNANPVLVCSHV